MTAPEPVHTSPLPMYVRGCAGCSELFGHDNWPYPDWVCESCKAYYDRNITPEVGRSVRLLHDTFPSRYVVLAIVDDLVMLRRLGFPDNGGLGARIVRRLWEIDTRRT